MSNKHVYYTQRRRLLQTDRHDHLLELQELEGQKNSTNYHYSREWDALDPAQQLEEYGQQVMANWSAAMAPINQQIQSKQQSFNGIQAELYDIEQRIIELDWRLNGGQ